MSRPLFRPLVPPILAVLTWFAIGILCVGAASAQPADLTVQTLAEIGSPSAIRHANDGSNRLFLVDRFGLIRIHDLNTGQTLATPFLDLTATVDASGGEQGLLGLAFDPDFLTNRRFFVSYTVDPGAGLDRSRIEAYDVSIGDPNVADPTSAEILFETEQDFTNHNGGDLHFGPDGYLYFGLGDGGSAGDPNDRSQTPTTLLGKMLRLDVDPPPRAVAGTPGSPPCGLVTSYAIPPDNPFASTAGFCPEIWAIGLRNPWRFSFDRLTGDLWIGDVGQDDFEEINRQPATSTGGENYGWSCREGSSEPLFNDCLAGPLVDPVLEYAHSSAMFCSGSVTGGFRYRGSMTDLYGLYVYADFCSGTVYFGDDTSGWSATAWATQVPSITTFGEDESGELYIGQIDGTISTLSSAQRAFFADGFESGTLRRWSSSSP